MWKANKQTSITLAISFVLALVIVYSGFTNILIAFFLVGAIPGTTMNIPPLVMLVGFAIIGLCVLFQTTTKKLLRIGKKKHRQLQRTARKRAMPKRHYSRV